LLLVGKRAECRSDVAKVAGPRLGRRVQGERSITHPLMPIEARSARLA